MKKVTTDQFFQDVIVPSFEQSVLVFVSFSDTIEQQDLQGVRDTISRVAPNAIQAYLDPHDDKEIISELSKHISAINAYNNDAENETEVNAYWVSLAAPSVVIFQNGKIRHWWSSFEGQYQKVRQWIVSKTERLNDYQRGDLQEYREDLEDMFAA